MKTDKNMRNHFVVENLIKYMTDNKLTKSAFADRIGFPEAKWNKISNGKQQLSVNELSNIAEKLQMKEIDILTYPKVFIEADSVDNDVRAQITIELKEELKDKVLTLVFGKHNMKILNK